MAKYVHELGCSNSTGKEYGPSVDGSAPTVIIGEEKCTWEDRELFYFIGANPINGKPWVVVPGFVAPNGWKSEFNQRKLPVTTVEPIVDSDLQNRIRLALQELKSTGKFDSEVQVTFWPADAGNIVDY